MSGSVAHAVEAQRLISDRFQSEGNSYATTNTKSVGSTSLDSDTQSAITKRDQSDYTVTLSEDAQSLLAKGQESGNLIDETSGDNSNFDKTDETVEPENGQTSEDEESDSQDQSNLSEDEQSEVNDLKTRDEEVRVHEQAHAATGGQYAGSPSYSYEQGPDGKRYITDGEVQIDVSPIPNDPQATIDKMRQVYRAALAPAEPSAADRSVANEAQQNIAEAMSELSKASSSNSDDANQRPSNLQTSKTRSTLESSYATDEQAKGTSVDLVA